MSASDGVRDGLADNRSDGNDWMTTTTLPENFASLAPFAPIWALPTQNGREIRRRASTSEQLQAFYDAIAPQLEEIIAYLNEFPLGKMPEPEQNLLYLTLSLAEVAPHVELYRGVPRVPYSFEEERFIADHGAVPGHM